MATYLRNYITAIVYNAWIEKMLMQMVNILNHTKQIKQKALTKTYTNSQ